MGPSVRAMPSPFPEVANQPPRAPPPSQPPPPGAGATSSNAQQIRRIATEFEAMVLGELLQSTFAQIDPNGLGGGGEGEEMFRPMLVQQYADGMARAGGIGLADSVVRELTRLQVAPATAENADAAHR